MTTDANHMENSVDSGTRTSVDQKKSRYHLKQRLKPRSSGQRQHACCTFSRGLHMVVFFSEMVPSSMPRAHLVSGCTLDWQSSSSTWGHYGSLCACTVEHMYRSEVWSTSEETK